MESFNGKPPMSHMTMHRALFLGEATGVANAEYVLRSWISFAQRCLYLSAFDGSGLERIDVLRTDGQGFRRPGHLWRDVIGI